MTGLDALLAGIVAHPHESLRWLIVADWLDDHGFADRAELLRLHRMLIDTCCEPDAHPDRAAWQARIVELIDQGVTPCVPQHTLMLPGGVPLVGNFIPPGSFLMGGREKDDEGPICRVTLTHGFFVGVSPVTQVQWRAVMGTDPSHFKGDELPVEMVSWEGGSAFRTRASELTRHTLRLLTEAEWEYACRAGTTTRYHYGDLPDTGRMNYCADRTQKNSSKYRTTTVAAATFAPNPWGLYDCHGNVWEWCADWYDPEFYDYSPSTNPVCWTGPQSHRVLRGGSWYGLVQSCRAADRDREEPGQMSFSFGFRVAFTLT